MGTPMPQSLEGSARCTRSALSRTNTAGTEAAVAPATAAASGMAAAKETVAEKAVVTVEAMNLVASPDRCPNRLGCSC